MSVLYSFTVEDTFSFACNYLVCLPKLFAVKIRTSVSVFNLNDQTDRKRLYRNLYLKVIMNCWFLPSPVMIQSDIADWKIQNSCFYNYIPNTSVNVITVPSLFLILPQKGRESFLSCDMSDCVAYIERCRDSKIFLVISSKYSPFFLRWFTHRRHSLYCNVGL